MDGFPAEGMYICPHCLGDGFYWQMIDLYDSDTMDDLHYPCDTQVDCDYCMGKRQVTYKKLTEILLEIHPDALVAIERLHALTPEEKS